MKGVNLPHGQRADIGTKLEEYTLNSLHRDGRHKARVFESKLGISLANADVLKNGLCHAAATADNVVAKGDNGYGEVYALEFLLATRLGSATVRSVWIIRYGEDFPRLTTCYIV